MSDKLQVVDSFEYDVNYDISPLKPGRDPNITTRYIHYDTNSPYDHCWSSVYEDRIDQYDIVDPDDRVARAWDIWTDKIDSVYDTTNTIVNSLRSYMADINEETGVITCPFCGRRFRQEYGFECDRCGISINTSYLSVDGGIGIRHEDVNEYAILKQPEAVGLSSDQDADKYTQNYKWLKRNLLQFTMGLHTIMDNADIERGYSSENTEYAFSCKELPADTYEFLKSSENSEGYDIDRILSMNRKT